MIWLVYQRECTLADRRPRLMQERAVKVDKSRRGGFFAFRLIKQIQGFSDTVIIIAGFLARWCDNGDVIKFVIGLHSFYVGRNSQMLICSLCFFYWGIYCRVQEFYIFMHEKICEKFCMQRNLKVAKFERQIDWKFG